MGNDQTSYNNNRIVVVDQRTFGIVHDLKEHQVVQVFNLYDNLWPSDTRTIDDLHRAIIGAEFVVGLVDSSDDVAGFCRVISDGGFRAWILGLVVRKDLRSIGLGRVLMDEVLNSKPLANVHSVGLTCEPHMIPFYKKWNFEVRKDESAMNLVIREQHS